MEVFIVNALFWLLVGMNIGAWIIHRELRRKAKGSQRMYSGGKVYKVKEIEG